MEELKDSIMSKHYGSYKHLLKREQELNSKMPEELALHFFGVEEVEVTEEVANTYKGWFYKK